MSYLRTTRRPLGDILCQGRWVPFLYYGRYGVLLGCYLARLFLQDRAFFLPGLTNDRFDATNVQCDPVIPSYVLPTPPVSSPCLDTNEEMIFK